MWIIYTSFYSAYFVLSQNVIKKKQMLIDISFIKFYCQYILSIQFLPAITEKRIVVLIRMFPLTRKKKFNELTSQITL